MKKKLTLSTTVTLIVLTAALAVSVTMMLAMRYFNRQVQWVSQRKAMYTYIDQADQALREHYATLNEETLRQNVIAGFVDGSGDPYAEYFTPQQYVDEQQRLSGYASNIGISLCKDENDNAVIYAVAPDSAADKAGVQKGDILTTVNGTDIIGKKLTDIQQAIISSEKTLLSVLREDATVAFELSPYRYVERSVQGSIIGTVGYIKISAFYENTPSQFTETMAELNKTGITGLIIDLRNNGGGLQSAMREMVSQLMPLGVYGSTIDKSGDSTVISSSVNAQLGVATVVLVNHHTAGEAEFIAGAMQEQSLATVIGVTTAGKAKYQEYIKINLDNSAIKLTNGYYSLLKGGSYEGKGITPNKEVTLTEDELAIFPLLTAETDPQLKTALAQFSTAESAPITDISTTTELEQSTTTTASTTAAK